MTLSVATVACSGPGLKLPEQPDRPRTDEEFMRDFPMLTRIDNTANLMTPCQAYQSALDQCDTDILCMFHDDVTVHDPDWINRILHLFENPDCVAVGFGGATSLGRPNLYKVPYNIWNMARAGYASNQTDAEVHGERFAGDRRVAVLDAFSMAVRVEWLRSRGGWPVEHLTFHCLDLWLACEAARMDRSIFMTGVSVTHHGGGASITESYSSALWLQGGSLESDHQSPHRWLFQEYRDVLPFAVK